MIYFCADDYGLSEKSCTRIETCLKDGVLNKISVLPNGEISHIDKRLQNSGALLSLHINLVEGKPISAPAEVGLLVSSEGYFKHSFGGLLLMSLSFKRKEFQEQIYTEIRNQLKFMREFTCGDYCMAIDSHQHTHMIPLIYKAMMRAVKDEGVRVNYLRIPAEPLTPYLLSPSLYLTYAPANLIKQWLLKFFALLNKKETKKAKIKPTYFMGVLFSGKMDENRVTKVLPHYIRLAKKRGRDLEVLFHPGYIESSQDLFDKNKSGFNKFYLSKGRKIEFDTLTSLEFKNNFMKEACENALP